MLTSCAVRLVRRSLPWLVFPACVATVIASANGDSTRLLRSPTVSATQIAFAYANNIWVVERAGGAGRRLTSFQGQTTTPHFSPDGKLIAFSGEYAGNVDVYVVPAEGGEPKRLTLPIADCRVRPHIDECRLMIEVPIDDRAG
jgi:tricorn protease